VSALARVLDKLQTLELCGIKIEEKGIAVIEL